MTTKKFFEEPTLNSQVKARIVSKYFSFWVTILAKYHLKNENSSKWIGYLDLFCGPGVYQDGSESTPIKVIKIAIQMPSIRDNIVFSFNDVNKNHCEQLESEISSIEGIELLKVFPRIYNFGVTTEIENFADKIKDFPFLSFVDPFGYKGVSLSLIEKLIKGWGSDTILFFNYSAINRALSNRVFENTDDLPSLFGTQKFTELRNKVSQINEDPRKREELILDYFSQSIKDIGGKYVLPFKFYRRDRQRVSHFLLFITKNEFAYAKMKEMMRKESTPTNQDGLMSFEFSEMNCVQPLIFESYISFDKLKKMILKTFSSKTLTVEQIYHVHQMNTPFILSDYKNALKELESEKLIKVTVAPGKKRRRNAMADHYIIKFGQYNQNEFD